MVTINIKPNNSFGPFLEIEVKYPIADLETFQFAIPIWRPGRYELQHYAKNIRNLRVYNQVQAELLVNKIEKSKWEVLCAGADEITISYLYFANKIDAGSTYTGANLLYINFINCVLMADDFMNEPHEINIVHNFEHEISSLLSSNKGQFLADSYFQLADSPFFASNQVQKIIYQVQNIDFTINFINADFENVEKISFDFERFTKETFAIFKEAPFQKYSFNFIITKFPFYHGVEHAQDTTIVLGPDYELNTKPFYDNILGIACHELFHAWNALAIRPQELQPYTFLTEPYFVTGYVIEGLTTYFGDYLLARAGVISENKYLDEISILINKVYGNWGYQSQSLADSSMDLWLDGYGTAIQHRRQSIYHHGAILALIIDILIRKNSNHTFSLDSLLLKMWEKFGKSSFGYSHTDILNLIQEFSNETVKELVNEYITKRFLSIFELNQYLSFINLEILSTENEAVEQSFGFKTSFANAKTIVSELLTNETLLWENDEILAVNGRIVDNNISALLKIGEENELIINREKSVKVVKIQPISNGLNYKFIVVKKSEAEKESIENYTKWLKTVTLQNY